MGDQQESYSLTDLIELIATFEIIGGGTNAERQQAIKQFDETLERLIDERIAKAMAMKPHEIVRTPSSVGDSSICESCHHPIKWTGKFWMHSEDGYSPRHIAEPAKRR